MAIAWPHLQSDDRAIRYAARIAIECQPVDTWRRRALSEADTQSALMAMIALSRQGNAGDLNSVLARLGEFPLESLPKPQQLATLRAYMLALVRLGTPDQKGRAALIARLDASPGDPRRQAL